MLALGDKNSACQALQKLDAEFPSATARVKAAVTTFKGRASCH
ncbi:tol-pal system YbgF family protein [Asaia platycodi]